jgi:hypothetical protein
VSVRRQSRCSFAIQYGLIKLNDEGLADGIKLLEYDNQGGPSEAADKLKSAINDGAHHHPRFLGIGG